jgi:hypothetical protein
VFAAKHQLKNAGLIESESIAKPASHLLLTEKRMREPPRIRIPRRESRISRHDPSIRRES